MTAPPPLRWLFLCDLGPATRASLEFSEGRLRKCYRAVERRSSLFACACHGSAERACAIEGVTNVMDVGLVEVRSQPNVQEVHHVTCAGTPISNGIDYVRTIGMVLPTRNGDESIPRCWFARRPLVGLSGICPDVRSSDTVTPVNVMDAGAGHAFPVLVVPRLFASHGGSCEHGHSDRR